jgi:hypothetical protein
VSPFAVNPYSRIDFVGFFFDGIDVFVSPGEKIFSSLFGLKDFCDIFELGIKCFQFYELSTNYRYSSRLQDFVDLFRFNPGIAYEGYVRFELYNLLVIKLFIFTYRRLILNSWKPSIS